jgi:hypothetical protein
MEMSEKAKETIKMFDEYLELAIIGYNAYGDKAEWKNYQGLAMTTWSDLPANIKTYWVCAAQAIANEYRNNHPESNEPVD